VYYSDLDLEMNLPSTLYVTEVSDTRVRQNFRDFLRADN
jgi:hypothetical protein